MEITNASIEDIDSIEEIATAAFKSTVYYDKPILTTHVAHNSNFGDYIVVSLSLIHI